MNSIFGPLQQLSRATNSAQAQSILSGYTIESPTQTTLGDGATQIATAITNPADDLSIPISTWTLRLVPTASQSGTGVRIPIALTVEPDGTFRSLRIDLARFELEADRNSLIAANMFVEPHTHLRRMPNGPPVVLRGPGLAIVLSGSSLDEFSLLPLGATGASSPEFPSLRFDPPHFIVGGTDDMLGVVCDEVLLDLDSDDNPQVVDDTVPGVGPEWRGLFLKELGIFIGDGTQVGTWSGMASLRDFFIGFDQTDLTGTFTAELVHYALENVPQVVVSIFGDDGSGHAVLVTDSGNASLPFPNGREFQRVRLVAMPNWDSAGFRVRWELPAVAMVEEPLRRTSLDLGWVQIPSGTHEFTVHVTDHRVDPQSETRRVTVAEAPAPTSPSALTAVFEGIVREASNGANRLHIALRPGGSADLKAYLGGGSGSANVTLTLPAGFSLSDGESASQTVTRPSHANAYPPVTWTVQAPVGPVALDAIVLSITDGATTLNRRLRVAVEPGPAAGQRDFELVSYTDWLAEPGIGLALVRPNDGLEFSDIAWTLDSESVTASVFSDASLDSLFNGAAYADTQPLSLANSAGTVRPHLGEMGRLWRLTGTLGPGSVTPGTRNPVVVGEPPLSNAMNEPEVTGASGFLGEGVVSDEHASNDGSAVRTIMFHYACHHIQPGTGTCSTVGPEVPAARVSFDDTKREQAKGFAALFKAIARYDAQIEAIRLFGAASVEGRYEYNLDLSKRRADNAKTALVSPSAELVSRMSLLTGADAYTYSATSAEANHISALKSVGKITTAAFGARSADSTINPQDRRVFAIIKLAPSAAPTSAIVHREYFVTLPGAPPPSAHPAPAPQRLQEHPFRHSIFRLAHVEVELLRNRLVRLQVRLKLDLEAFNENDLDPITPSSGRRLNDLDGVTTFFLEMIENPSPGPGEARYSWELAVLADPGDIDGLYALSPANSTQALRDGLGAPAIVVPPLTAIAGGGRVGVDGFGVGVVVGAILTHLKIVDVQHLVWRGLRLKLKHGNVERPTISFAVDYTVKYSVDVDLSALGLPLPAGASQLRTDPTRPIEISFRNMGVEVRDLRSVEFFYDPADGFQLDVNDPGVFRLGDGIGRLLQVNRFSTGGGRSPLWMEVDLALAVDTGIFTITSLRIRVSLETEELFAPDASGEVKLGPGSISLSSFDVQINKMAAAVDVPGVLNGSGGIELAQSPATATTPAGTTVAGDLDLSLVPLDLRVYGGIKVFSDTDLQALYAYLGVEFAPGIPLGNTGAAIFGFLGLVGVNMGRSDANALRWFVDVPPAGDVTNTSKWIPRRGNWAFGVGTVVGTVYDNGLTFNTKGAFILEVPGPKFLLATKSNFITPKPAVGGAGQGTLLSTVLLDFENDLLQIGIDFEFSRAPLIKFRVPTEAFFNLADPSDWHVRFGQWLPASKRITLEILGIWNAWGYFVVEGDGHQVPGHIDLRGICLGHGARLEVFWGSRSAGVYVEASAEYHVGLQLDPLFLMGDLTIRGELHLGPVAIGAHAALAVKAPTPFVIRGEVCGKVDLWLFSIEGCVSFEIGDGDAPPPPPNNPFKEMTVIDRMSASKVADPQKAPLDALMHLVFDQDMIDARTPPGTSLVTGNLRNQVSGDLFYEYRLTQAQIFQAGSTTPVADVPSAWGAYTLPNATAAEADSARTLRLLAWVPHSHDRALDFRRGYEQTLKALIHRLCDRAPEPRGGCATFDEEPLGRGSMWVLDEAELAPVTVVSSQPDGMGAEHIGTLSGFSAARVVALVPVDYDERAPEKRCLRLPCPATPARWSLRDLFGRRTVVTTHLAMASTHGDGIANLVRALVAREPAPESLMASSLRAAPRVTASHATTAQPTMLLLSGMLFVRLPDLVACDAVFITSDKLRYDGEAVFLDGSFVPVSQVMSIGDAPPAPNTTAAGAFSNHSSHVVSFGPPPRQTEEPLRAAWLVVKAPSGLDERNYDPYSYLNEICGIEYGSYKDWLDREASRQRTILELQNLTGVVGGVPAASTQILLEPNTTYEIRGRLGWERFRNATTTSNDGAAPNAFTINASFKTDNQAPKDIRRYIASHTPHDDEQPHYFAEALRITFASDVIDRVFKAYGRQLVARAKAATGGHAVNQPLSEGTTAQFFPLGAFEQTLYDALQDISRTCAPGAWEKLFPKSVFTLGEPLTPNTGYSISLLPRSLGEPGAPGSPGAIDEAEWNRRLQAAFDNNEYVFRFDMCTSRYSSFSDHMSQFRAATIGDLIAGDTSALSAALAGFTSDRADAAVDALCAALFGGPISIPAEPQVLRIWVATGPPPDAFSPPPLRCRAILVDGPEPLLKLDAAGGPRTHLEARATTTGTFAAGTSLAGLRIVTGRRGARTFVLFDPTSPPAAVALRIRDQATGTADVVEELVVSVGATPGSFDEEA